MTYPEQPVLTKPDSGNVFVHSASTVTASGSTVVSGVGSKELTLVVNVTVTPTGTTPTLTYTLQEVDPGDLTAVFGPIASTSTINAIGVYTVSLGATTGGAVKVSWAISGAGASFTGVYATASTKVGTASNASGAITVTGTVTASNASTGTNNAAAPSSSTQVGGSDGTNLQAARVFDADTGGGTQYVLGTVLRKTASGGSVEAGTAADPLRVDPTGTTTQPISAASLPLPTGAATETTLGTRLADATFTGRINTLGQKTSANSTPVVLSSDQSAIPITDNAGSLTVDSAQLPAALVGARLDVNNGAWLGSTAPTVGSKTSANSIPVVIASDQGAVAVSGTVTANVGTTNGLALDATLTGNNQRTRLTDGTNLAAVKAASTAAVASDPALVVAVSPNNSVAITAASLPLPSGAATAAKQPALGTAGSASSDVITVQGIASMTALRVDGSAVTQPVSGTITANIGTSGSLALDATLTGGTQVAQIRSGAKGSSAAALVTSTASGANHQPIDVAIYDASGNQITSFGGGTQFADGTARGSATGTLMMVDDGTNIQSASGDSSGRINVNINTGTVTANIGTSGSLALDATLTGGTQKAITRGGAKGSTTAADVTSTASGANHQTLDVAIYDASGNQITTFGGGTQFADGAARGTATGTLMMVDDGTNIQSASGDSSGRLNTLSRITDGTNTAAVKAASTAAVASDPALVVAISPNNSLTVAPSTSSTATLTNVAGSASSVQLLASNAARKGATVHNDSSSALYIKLGTTASTSSFTVRLLAQAYYEVPFTYTGRIDGIWGSATGNARITELT